MRTCELRNAPMIEEIQEPREPLALDNHGDIAALRELNEKSSDAIPQQRLTVWRRLRRRQIRVTSEFLCALAGLPFFVPILTVLGKSSILTRSLLGYRRAYDTIEQAETDRVKFSWASHDHPDAVRIHLDLAAKARPSDYPVLFHLQRLLNEGSSILDLGGNAGNLFYSYSTFLNFSKSLRWIVYDLPAVVARGRAIASAKKETRLHFVDKLSDCPPADVLIISGALHYLKQLPPTLIDQLSSRPKHVFVNRSPISSRGLKAVIQEGGLYVTSARIISYDALLESMSRAGYVLIDEWSAPELSLQIPLCPQDSLASYHGCYFRLGDPCE